MRPRRIFSHYDPFAHIKRWSFAARSVLAAAGYLTKETRTPPNYCFCPYYSYSALLFCQRSASLPTCQPVNPSICQPASPSANPPPVPRQPPASSVGCVHRGKHLGILNQVCVLANHHFAAPYVTHYSFLFRGSPLSPPESLVRLFTRLIFVRL